MIIVKLMGGLGNQLFQYALGRRLAYQHRTSLKLDLTWFQTQTLRSYQLDVFNISAEIALPGEIEKYTRAKWGGLRGRIHHAVEGRIPYYWQRVVMEQVPFFDPNIVKKVSRNAYLSGYWQSEKYFSPIEPILRQDFQLKVPFSVENKLWVEQASQPFAVSVHVRRTDYVENKRTNRLHGSCSPEYYCKAAAYVRNQIPQAAFIVFSDDLAWVRQNLDFLSPACFVDAVGPRKDEEELMLMALCQHSIIANSSYSWWGAWLGSNPQKIVIAPSRWFNVASSQSSDLLPEEWIKL